MSKNLLDVDSQIRPLVLAAILCSSDINNIYMQQYAQSSPQQNVVLALTCGRSVCCRPRVCIKTICKPRAQPNGQWWVGKYTLFWTRSSVLQWASKASPCYLKILRSNTAAVILLVGQPTDVAHLKKVRVHIPTMLLLGKYTAHA